MRMSHRPVRNSLVAALAVATLPLMTGCGGSSGSSGTSGPDSSSAASDGSKTADGAAQLAVPDGTDDNTKKTYIQENATAACMKKQGFTYTPHVAPPASDAAATGTDGEDYALTKKYRQKYGFGTYAAAAYPDDPIFSNAGGRGGKGGTGGKTVIPEDDDEKGFTPAQLKAYDTALNGPPARSKAEEKLGGCTAEARIKAYGPELSAKEAKKQQTASEERNRANGLALNGDTQLVQLAQQYATCLRAEGIPVSTTQPTGMAAMVQGDITSSLPEHHDVSKEEALPLLTKEIPVALKDLECGKDFRAAYFPKEKANPYWGSGA